MKSGVANLFSLLQERQKGVFFLIVVKMLLFLRDLWCLRWVILDIIDMHLFLCVVGVVVTVYCLLLFSFLFFYNFSLVCCFFVVFFVFNVS